jgi:hypothetical protein
MNKKELIRELDSIISDIAKCHKPQVEPKPDDEYKNIIDPHHIINRNHYLFRWDLRNIMFLARTQHIEQENMKDAEGNHIDYRTMQQALFFAENNNKSFKKHLQEQGITENEFLENEYFRLTHRRIRIDRENSQEIKLRTLKTKSKKHQQTLELQRDLRKKAYRRLKEWQNKKKLDLENSLDRIQLVNV